MEAIDNILHYINHHFDEDLSLEMLAEQAHYSPFHFHRLFKQQVGEPPKQYLLRLRLEKAIKHLIFYPKKSVYAIAMDCGFSSQSVFARAFKNKHGVSAEQYREQAVRVLRERSDIITPDVQQYPVTISRMERIYVATEMTLLLHETGIMTAFKRLQVWAEARELIGKTPEFFGIFIDSPFSTPLDKCRYLTAIRINKAVTEKGCQTLGGMTIAQIPVLGDYELLTDYAIYVKHRWIESSGYEIIQGISGFERFESIDFARPYSAHYRSICVPVQPK